MELRTQKESAGRYAAPDRPGKQEERGILTRPEPFAVQMIPPTPLGSRTAVGETSGAPRSGQTK